MCAQMLARVRISKPLRSPEIDSKESIPPAYAPWQAGTSNRVVVTARKDGNRFLGSLKGLQIRAQESSMGIYCCLLLIKIYWFMDQFLRQF